MCITFLGIQREVSKLSNLGDSFKGSNRTNLFNGNNDSSRLMVDVDDSKESGVIITKNVVAADVAPSPESDKIKVSSSSPLAAVALSNTLDDTLKKVSNDLNDLMVSSVSIAIDEEKEEVKETDSLVAIDDRVAEKKPLESSSMSEKEGLHKLEKGIANEHISPESNQRKKSEWEKDVDIKKTALSDEEISKTPTNESGPDDSNHQKSSSAPPVLPEAPMTCIHWFTVILKVSIPVITGVVVIILLGRNFTTISSKCLNESWGIRNSGGGNGAEGVASHTWCSNKNYYPNGVLSQSACNCIVVSVPDCHNGLNKTVPRHGKKSSLFENIYP